MRADVAPSRTARWLLWILTAAGRREDAGRSVRRPLTPAARQATAGSAQAPHASADRRRRLAASSSSPGATTATATRRATCTSASRRSATTSRSSACGPATARRGPRPLQPQPDRPAIQRPVRLSSSTRSGASSWRIDHIKWIVREDQTVRMTGTLNGAPVDTDVALTQDVLRYQLNNGANPVFVNLIRRYRLAGEPGRTGYFAFLAKAGGGFADPAHGEHAVRPTERARASSSSRAGTWTPRPPSACTSGRACTSSSRRSSCTRATSASTSISGTAGHSRQGRRVQLQLRLGVQVLRADVAAGLWPCGSAAG